MSRVVAEVGDIQVSRFVSSHGPWYQVTIGPGHPRGANPADFADAFAQIPAHDAARLGLLIFLDALLHVPEAASMAAARVLKHTEEGGEKP